MSDIPTLSGAASDVLYSLFFRGALNSGDLPAKNGAAELRELGFTETGVTATKYQGEDYVTWLTPRGQEFAIEYFVKTKFGKPTVASLRSFQTLAEPSIKKGLISEAHICGNTIEQETLSKLLIETLPTVSTNYFGDVAVSLSGAVKAAFNALEYPAGGFVNAPTSQTRFGEKSGETVLPNSALKVGTNGDGKQASTITVRVEIDTSDALQAIDEFSSAIATRLDSIIAKSLQPGGAAWLAIRNS